MTAAIILFTLAFLDFSAGSYFGIFMLDVHAECGFRLMTDATVFFALWRYMDFTVGPYFFGCVYRI